VCASEAAGLDPVTDGGRPADADLALLVATQRLTDHALKQAVAGPTRQGSMDRGGRAQPRHLDRATPSTRNCAIWRPRAVP
jgi:hypothetical protein